MDGWSDDFTTRLCSLVGATYSFRFCVLDNSKTMTRPDRVRPILDRGVIVRWEDCTRWEEACSSVSMMSRIADGAGTPMEIRFVHSKSSPPFQPQQPLIVGKKKDDGASLTALIDALAAEPAGPKAVCRVLTAEVVDQVRWIEDILRITNKVRRHARLKAAACVCG